MIWVFLQYDVLSSFQFSYCMSLSSRINPTRKPRNPQDACFSGWFGHLGSERWTPPLAAAAAVASLKGCLHPPSSKRNMFASPVWRRTTTTNRKRIRSSTRGGMPWRGWRVRWRHPRGRPKVDASTEWRWPGVREADPGLVAGGWSPSPSAHLSSAW